MLILITISQSAIRHPSYPESSQNLSPHLVLPITSTGGFGPSEVESCECP